MKLKVLNIIFSLFIMACGISSCLDSDVTEYEFSSDASITAFSIADSIVTLDLDGTVYTVSTDTSADVSVWGGSSANKVSVRNVVIKDISQR